MANPKHLAKLLEGREAWNAWRLMEDGVAADLRGAMLESLDLSGFELSVTDLRAASLRAAILTKTTIGGAIARDTDWTGARLTDVRFFESDAEGALFDGARIVWSRFDEDNLNEASFRGAEVFATTFTSCRMNSVDFSNTRLSSSVIASSIVRDLRGIGSIRATNVAIGIETFFFSGGLPDELLRIANLPEEFITYARSLTGKAIEYYSCFISYSSKDDEFTRRLHADLQARKIKTWFAPEDLKIGDRFHSRIDESIRIHDKLVLILSANSIDSAWVRREVEAALEREDREKKDILFPIRLDETIFDSKEAWAAEIKRSRHIGDFRNWKSHDDYTAGLDRLVKDLKKEGPIIMR